VSVNNCTKNNYNTTAPYKVSVVTTASSVNV